MMRLHGRVLCVVSVLGAVGCTGVVGGDAGKKDSSAPGLNPSGGASSIGPGPSANPAGTCREGGSLASARVSLLSSEQYVNVIRDVFSVDFVPESMPVRTGEYTIDESAAVGSVEVAERYHRAADQVASKVKPCGSSDVTAACLEPFLRQKLPLAWKRAVTEAEITGLMGIFNGGLVDGAGRALELVMEAALGARFCIAPRLAKTLRRPPAP